jgi:diguanylate cyclase (GGDEF)-like protein/PAS domain S-box-containing protein
MKLLSVKAKLTAILAIPTLFMFTFLTLYFLYCLQESRESDQAVKVLTYYQVVNDLVHELQLERGLSVRFIRGNHRNFQKPLSKQRINTDKSIEHFKRLEKQSEQFKQAIAESEFPKQLTLLSELRQSVNSHHNDKFENYTTLIWTSINVIERLRNQVSRTELVLKMDFYLQLIWLKEFAGLERGNFQRVFEFSSVDLASFAEMAVYHEKQKMLLYQLQQTVIQSLAGGLNQIVSDPNNELLETYLINAKKVARKQKRLNRRDDRAWNTMSADWWTIATKRIDGINNFIQQTNTHYIALENEYKDAMYFDLYLDISLILITVLTYCGLAYRTTRQVVKDMRVFSRKMEKIELDQDYTPLRIETQYSEFINLIISFNNMLTAINLAKHELLLSSTFFNGSEEGMVVADEQNQAIVVNPAFSRITGYSQDEVQGKNLFFMLSDKTTYSLINNKAIEAIQANGNWEGDLSILNSAGSTSSIRVSVSYIKDKSKQTANYIYLFKNLDKWKKYEEEIWIKANFDALTNLPNRNMCMEKLQHVIQQSQANDVNAAVLFIDLDNFKLINDTLGHKAGDQLLCQVSERLSQYVAKNEMICRVGGDEFIIIIPEIESTQQIKWLARQLNDEIANPYLLSNKHETVISASTAILITPDAGLDFETLLKNADTAMYHAKKSGRNNCQLYSRVLNTQVTQRMELEQALHLGLKRNEFIAHYQPIFDLKSKEVVGVEALIRWQHPVKGLVYPGDFIAVAEETGIVVEFGKQMIYQAFEQIVSWQKQGIDIHIAVNLSSKQFTAGNAEDLVILIESQLTKHNIAGKYLHVEITEHVFMEDTELVAQTLNRLRVLGITVHLDDFGTGYSSLSYLLNFPVDYLKIDQSFVNRLNSNDNASKVIKSITVMAKELGLKIVAEGIEEEYQYDFLKQIGCDYGQGYWYARPMPVELLNFKTSD